VRELPFERVVKTNHEMLSGYQKLQEEEDLEVTRVL